jgi:hypothetical protein
MFFRVPDHQRGHALVARDDGVIYRLDGGPFTAELPHDLVHLTVEDALGMTDGIWGAIAGGVVFRSMTHHSGRRPPHAAERSAALIRQYRSRLQRAELIGGFVERVANGLIRVDDSRRYLATLPAEEIDTAAITSAAQAVREAQARWRALPVGEQLTRHWPAYRTVKLAAPRQSRRRRETASSSTSSRLQNANRTSRRPASWSS